MNISEYIAVLDFGSQYTQLIARRIRELGVFATVFSYDAPLADYASDGLIGIVLSGGPSSVSDPNAPPFPEDVLSLNVPVFGICYGMQLLAKRFGGQLTRSETREYGKRSIASQNESELLAGVPDGSVVWMSHGDSVDTAPADFIVTASTTSLPISAIENPSRKLYGVQFHPEVAHTEKGMLVLENFVRRICGAKSRWDAGALADQKIAEIREMVGDESKVLLGYSGGVDSTVVAALLIEAIGDRLVPVFVDTGLLRLNEGSEVKKRFEDNFGIELVYVDGAERFFSELSGITDPEEKRRIIGRTFIDVFENAVSHLSGVAFLAQGTLYPDLIESRSYRGPSATIKTHHNVGGLPDKLGFELVEPLKELFKDEVRALGRALDIPEDMIGRHPFPGPGLAVRILGEVSRERVALLQEADAIFIDMLRDYDLYDKVWQAFAVLLPVRSVGVMGDERTYENAVVLRAVTSLDGMTADWAKLPDDFLSDVSNEIINRVKGINRVVYDISSKPPATIEWE